MCGCSSPLACAAEALGFSGTALNTARGLSILCYDTQQPPDPREVSESQDAQG